MIAKVSRGLGEAMVGINVEDVPVATGWRSAAGERPALRSGSSPCRATSASTSRALDGLGRRARSSVRRPAELAGLDGLVIPGGESTTIGKLAVIFELLEPLREAIAGGLPAYGSCAGMILLADRIEDGLAGQPTIGGLDMTVRRNAFGRQVDSFEGPVEIDRHRRGRRFTRSSSGRRGSSRSVRTSRCSGAPPVGSSPCVTGTCSRPRSTRS